MARRATPLAALLIALAVAPLSPGARAPTPDEQLVTGLETATAASRAALRSLASPTTKRAARAEGELGRALTALDAATRAAPRAVGALETPSVRAALRQARMLGRQAAADVARGHYTAARLKIERALALKEAALADFGVPLEKEFTAFVVNRDFRNVSGFTDYSGLSATVSEEVVEIVIGAADRTTANAGEPGGSVSEASGLPITATSVYLVSDPIGRFWSDWCSLRQGLITCQLVRGTMHPTDIFTIAFGPKLKRGTKLLVKFRSATGRRSYAVFTTR
jgi:hypothetical protein